MSISRRTFLKIASYSTLAGLSSCIGTSEKLPNILLILVDSLNDWTSVLGGHPNGSTPNIDKLAQRGLLFTNAHSVGTNSNSSRTSLFTGLHPISSGIYRNSGNYRSIYPQLTTLPQYFMRLRYQVRGSGRLLHQPDFYTWQSEPYEPFDNNFVQQQLSGVDFGPNFDWGALDDVVETQMHDFRVAQWASDTIQRAGGPFFLGLGLSSTRPPWYLPRAKYERFSPSSIVLPNETRAVIPETARNIIDNNLRHRTVLNHNQWGNAVAAYLACMTFVDEMIGKVISALDESEHANNTIIILTSPHGIHLGDKGYWLYDTLWEQLTRVPLIISVPNGNNQTDRISAGQICNSAVSLLDIYPTILDLWGLDSLHKLDGRSLMPLLQDPNTDWNYPVLTARSNQQFAIRSNRWRYINYQENAEELYEYIGDPDELINIANNPARDSIKQELRQYLPENPAPIVVEVTE